MKTNGREKRAERSLAFHVFGVLFVYCSFWHLSAQGCRQNVWPSCLFIFCLYVAIISLFSFFPFAFPFLVISSLSLLRFFLLHAILFYYSPCIFLHVCFTWSFCYFLYDCLPLFFCLCPFAFLILFVSFITLKHRNSKKNNVCTSFWKNLSRKVSNNWKPPKHQMIIEFAKNCWNHNKNRLKWPWPS